MALGPIRTLLCLFGSWASLAVRDGEAGVGGTWRSSGRSGTSCGTGLFLIGFAAPGTPLRHVPRGDAGMDDGDFEPVAMTL